MKKITSALLIASSSLLLTQLACTNNNKEEILAQLGPCDTSSVSYATDIKPIINQFCSTTGCHNAVSVAGGRNFETHATLQTNALNPVFLSSIRHESGTSPMPKGSAKLDDCKIKKITRWVNQGALNN